MTVDQSGCTAEAEQPQTQLDTDTRLGQSGWFHRYPARFHDEVVSQMFDGVENRLGRRPTLVLDPFCGTGKTLSAARSRSVRSLGIELSRLGILISAVRLRPPSDLEASTKAVETISKSDVPVGTPNEPGYSELEAWMGDKNARAVYAFRDQVLQLPDARTRDWGLLALSASLRPSSCWLPGSIKPQKDKNRVPPDIGTGFRRAVRQLFRDSTAELRGCQQPVSADVICGDARALPIRPGSVDVIITSPPYGSMYDYFDVQRLTYLAFDWPRPRQLQIGNTYHVERDGVGFVPPPDMADWYRNYYRAELTTDGRALRAYIQSMATHFSSAYAVLQPGGIVAYAVGNSMRDGKEFNLVSGLAHLMQTTGFTGIEVVDRQIEGRRILPAGRDPKTGRFSGEAAPMVAEKTIFARKPS